MYKNIYLQEAIRIGDQLLITAIHDKHGTSWKSLHFDNDLKFSWEAYGNMYSGVAGIAFYLLSLYRVTQNNEYLKVAKDGLRWVEWYYKELKLPFIYSFLPGRMGSAFVYLKLYEITQNKSDLQKAVNIALKSEIYLKNKDKLNEYIDGAAGTLLCLLHIHAVTKNKKILQLINDYTQDLVDNAHYSKNGLYWDITPIQTYPLCGFSHGVSGIGFVFLELGHYFNNSSFYFIAEQAFVYENSCFNKKIKNWPYYFVTLKINPDFKLYEEAYLKGNLSLFNQIHDFTLWCHGAGGIGQSRIRAYELTGKYKNDIKKAINKTKKTMLNTFTLCHGNGGNADLFIEQYLKFHNKHSFRVAQQIAHMALEQKEKNGKYIPGFKTIPSTWAEDPSLFSGIAGIGYFFLRVYSPETLPSILAPSINSTTKFSKSNKTLAMTLPQLRKTLINNIFPRTMKLLSLYTPEQVDIYFETVIKTSEKKDFIKFIKTILISLSKKQKKEIMAIYKYELFKISLESTTNNGILTVKEKQLQNESNKLLSLTDTVFNKQFLQLTSETNIFKINNSYIILKAISYGMLEQEVNEFCNIVLSIFKEKTQIQVTIKKIIATYNIPDNLKKAVEENIITQIKEGIRNGLLTQKYV